jgi:transposase-like protein
MAVKTPEPGLSIRVHGLHPLQSQEGRADLSRAAYVVLGVTTEGYKEILSITVGANESSKFWLGMLNDLKKFASDFKAVYNAPNEKAGLEALSDVREKWGKKYPYAVSNWEDVSPFFQFPDAVRRIMYTTNIIEGLNRQYRKVTKTKSVFPSDSSLEKMLYLASLNVAKKWTQRYRNWDQVLNQLTVLYGERLTQYL